MAGRDLQLRQLRQVAEDLDARTVRFDHALQARIEHRRHAVQDQAADAALPAACLFRWLMTTASIRRARGPGIPSARRSARRRSAVLRTHLFPELHHPAYEGGDAHTGALRVHHEDGRGVEDVCDFPGRCTTRHAAEPVIVPHHALDKREFRTALHHTLRENPPKRGRIREEAVEVSRRHAEYPPVEHRVNVVGPALEALNLYAPFFQYGKKTTADCGLSCAASIRGDDDFSKCMSHRVCALNAAGCGALSDAVCQIMSENPPAWHFAVLHPGHRRPGPPAPQRLEILVMVIGFSARCM